MGPSKDIVTICGGEAVVADWLGLDQSTVYRWSHSKDARGCDGYIPAAYHERLLLKAREAGKPLRPEHFFPTVFPQFTLAAVAARREAANANRAAPRRRKAGA